tara:strand:+ start:555 stop:1016 length:462 start_codon:yes stop_codon:yes gene_type:complete
MSLIVRQSIIPDCYSIAPRMREADKKEVSALGRKDTLSPLLDGFVQSYCCYTLVDKQNIPHAMFGCCPSKEFPNMASIWLLGTDDIFTYRMSFLKLSKKYLKIISEPYNLVFNIVHKDNVVHIKWLQWLGFSFLRKISYGENNEHFYEFARIV